MKKIAILFVCFLVTIVVLIFVSMMFFSKKNDSAPVSIVPTSTELEVSSAPFIVTTPSLIPRQDIRSDAPAQEWQQTLEQYKGDEPDFYLMNFAMHRDTSFSMRYEFKKTPIEHYVFIVTLTGADKAKAKQDVLSWIKSTGLTDTQISTLDIQYVQ